MEQSHENTAAMAGTSQMAMGRNNEARSSAGSNAAARAVSAVADTTTGTSSTAQNTSSGTLAHAGSVAVLRTGIVVAGVVVEAAVSSEEDETTVQRSSNRDRDRSGEAYQRR